MQTYQNLAYLLGCYMVIADKEINSLELAVLDNYLSDAISDELKSQKQQIFSDDESKPDLATLLSKLKLTHITSLQKGEILGLLSEIAYGDDYMAEQERMLLSEIAKALKIDATAIIQASETRSKERLEASRLNSTKRVIGKVENYVYNLLPSQKNNISVDLLLGSLAYSSSIEDITDNAIVDLRRVSKIIDIINDSLLVASDSLDNIKFLKHNNSKEVHKVAEIIGNIKNHFNDLINVSLRENREVLEKKNRNIRYFTIAFMGRTKAGKSTLHKVITQEDNDDIGVGKIRTTRYNRSWYWNKLRVVDTPGIGAPGGATDTEIARSVIDEADVICYVVTSDSIQETEFDFFDTIKERNKPLYIVLNVKSNLTQSIRLKRFLENPTAWRDCSGSQSIQGHMDRIHDRLDGKYNMDAVEIIPIHLLAAQLSFSPAFSDTDAKKLRESSNIYSFTQSITSTVHKTGGIKKSLSVVDGTAYQIHSIKSSIDKDLAQLKEGHNLLISKLKKFKSFMNAEKGRLISDVKSIFSSVKLELRNRASAFAEEHYDHQNAGSLWGNDYTVKSIKSRMNSRLIQRMDDFNEKVKSQIEEIAEDIKVLGSFSINANVSGENITNTRLGVGIIGTILTGAATFAISNIWNPAGWVVGLGAIVVGAIASLITGLFTSKNEKIRKAKEKMREQLYSSIDKNINESQKKYLDNVSASINKTTSSIISILTTYVNGTDQIIKNIEEVADNCLQGESAINSLVSFRLLEFVGKRIIKEKAINYVDNKTLIRLYPVERDWIAQSMTYKYEVKLSEKDKEKIIQATQMKIY